MVQAQGVGYPAIIVRNLRESVEFYQRLGLMVLYVEPNRDDSESMCALMYAGGNDTFLLLVGPAEGVQVNLAEAVPGAGSLQYLSFNVSLETMRQMWNEMSRSGVHGSEEIARGYERIVFMEDPNGVMVTLTAWSVEPPPGLPRALVLARAASIREQEGSKYVEEAHVRQAIAEITSGAGGAPPPAAPSAN